MRFFHFFSWKIAPKKLSHHFAVQFSHQLSENRLENIFSSFSLKIYYPVRIFFSCFLSKNCLQKIYFSSSFEKLPRKRLLPSFRRDFSAFFLKNWPQKIILHILSTIFSSTLEESPGENFFPRFLSKYRLVSIIWRVSSRKIALKRVTLSFSWKFSQKTFISLFFDTISLEKLLRNEKKWVLECFDTKNAPATCRMRLVMKTRKWGHPPPLRSDPLDTHYCRTLRVFLRLSRERIERKSTPKNWRISLDSFATSVCLHIIIFVLHSRSCYTI